MPRASGEKETVLRLLAFQRDTLRWKCTGLTVEQLARRHAPSTMSLGGLLKHLAVVEAGWIGFTFAGGLERPSWMSQYERETPGWTWRTAASDPPERLFAWLDESQQVTERVVAGTGLDTLAEKATDDGVHCSLRWILFHLVQEYGRHLGHADLLREAADGSVGV